MEAQSWARSIECTVCGEWHFGAGGAAGLLLVRRDSTLPGSPATHIVMQHRADDGFWSIPGGVRDYGETFREAAFREAWEEVSLPLGSDRAGAGAGAAGPPAVVVRGEATLLDHGDWRYTTFIADVVGPFEPARPPGDFESLSVGWVPVGQVGVRGGRFFPLLPSFWEAWQTLLPMVQSMGPLAPAPAPAQAETDESVPPPRPASDGPTAAASPRGKPTTVDSVDVDGEGDDNDTETEREWGTGQETLCCWYIPAMP